MAHYMCGCECTCRSETESVFMFVLCAWSPESVQADSWPAVSGSDHEEDNTKVMKGSLRCSVCFSMCVYGCSPLKTCLVAAHVQLFPPKQLFCVYIP